MSQDPLREYGIHPEANDLDRFKNHCLSDPKEIVIHLQNLSWPEVIPIEIISNKRAQALSNEVVADVQGYMQLKMGRELSDEECLQINNILSMIIK